MKISKNISRRNFLKNAAIASSIFIVPRRVLGGPGYLAPSDKVTMGVIGCGKQSAGLQRRFANLNGVQIVAACDPYAAKLEKLVNANNQTYAELNNKVSYNATQAFEDYRELLAKKDIDAVIIASPDRWHATKIGRAHV